MDSSSRRKVENMNVGGKGGKGGGKKGLIKGSCNQSLNNKESLFRELS